jgi:hypothetical protein
MIMAHKPLPFIHSFRNRHGTLVHYFRKRGCKIVRLRGLPGSSEFMRAYETALGNVEPIVIGADVPRLAPSRPPSACISPLSRSPI